MTRETVLDLNDCTEFRQTIEARPPRLVHATVILLIMLLAAAGIWSAATEADLVVIAEGRVRPMVRLEKIAAAVDEETTISAQGSGAVAEVHVQAGDRVRAKDLLVKIDAQSMDYEISKRRALIESAEIELERINRLQQLLSAEMEAARSHAAAELTQARGEIGRLEEKQLADIRAASAAVERARDNYNRVRALAPSRVATQAELIHSRAALREAEAHLESARLPLDESRPAILEQELALAERRHVSEMEELTIRRDSGASELKANKLELADLQRRRDELVIRAPADGIVTNAFVQVGSVVEAGAPLVSISDVRGFRLDVAVGSDDVGHLAVGMPARIKFDAFDHQQYGALAGSVVYISPDTELGRDAPGARAAYYTVRIELFGDELTRGNRRGKVKLGMTGRAEIITQRESLLWLFVRGMRGSFSLG
jgi:HlyD family type I secretion membrane fusion protein